MWSSGASPLPQETEHGPARGVHTCAARAHSLVLPDGDAASSPRGWGSSCRGQATSWWVWASHLQAPPPPTHPNLFRRKKWSPAPQGLPLPADPLRRDCSRAPSGQVTNTPPWPPHQQSLRGGAESWGSGAGLLAHLACSASSLEGTGLTSTLSESNSTQPQAPVQAAGHGQHTNGACVPSAWLARGKWASQWALSSKFILRPGVRLTVALQDSLLTLPRRPTVSRAPHSLSQTRTQ